MYVIALKGKSDSGKSTTLNIVYQLLLADGYNQLEYYPVNFGFRVLGDSKHNDFIDILERNSKLVGFATMGDFGEKDNEPNGDCVKKLLKDLYDAGCTTAICAISENVNVSELQSYPHKIIHKTIQSNSAKERIANGNDAQAIFKMI